MLDFLSKYTQPDLQEDNSLEFTKEALTTALRKIGVVSVKAEYKCLDGEGTLEDITALNADNSTVNLIEQSASLPFRDKPTRLDAEVREFARDAIAFYHEEESGFGTFTIHADTDRVTISHTGIGDAPVHSEDEI